MTNNWWGTFGSLQRLLFQMMYDWWVWLSDGWDYRFVILMNGVKNKQDRIECLLVVKIYKWIKNWIKVWFTTCLEDMC